MLYRVRTSLAGSLAVAALAAAVLRAGPAQAPPGAIVLDHVRVVVGDGTVLTDAAVVVTGERIADVGPSGRVRRPAGAAVVDLTGRTVMPALVDAHSHLGYTHVASGRTSAAEYTRANLVDHLQRYAYYGIAATLSMGLDRGETAFELRQAPPTGAARYLTAWRGIAMPDAGPNAAHWRDAAYGVTTEAEARAAVRELAGRRVDVVKIWVDDRNKTVTPLPPSIYAPLIAEAHARGLRVVAHVYYLADAKALLRAGIDGFAHGVRDLAVDDEFLALLRERPNVFVIPNLPDTPPSLADLDRLAETLPAARVAELRRTAVERPPRPRLFEPQARSLARLHAAGIRIAFGTDAGVGAPYGWSAHTELADMVAAGLTPGQAITAATKTSAEILGLADLGSVAAGKSADLLVIDGNPLDDITRTQRIDRVYLRGRLVDRASLSSAWRRDTTARSIIGAGHPAARQARQVRIEEARP